MGDEIPTLDLRVSEFSPDRGAATASWAARELQRSYEKTKAERDAADRADKERWDAYRLRLDEQQQAEADRLAALRVEAVKRGEVYAPPLPALPHPAYSASVHSYGYATGAVGTQLYR